MKTTAICCLAFLLLSSSSAFAAEKSQADTAYAKAVASYVDAAEQQLRSIREAVDAIDKSADNVKPLYADVYKRLDQCDALVQRLKSATPAQFDPLKAEFEGARAQMIKAIERAKNPT